MGEWVQHELEVAKVEFVFVDGFEHLHDPRFVPQKRIREFFLQIQIFFYRLRKLENLAFQIRPLFLRKLGGIDPDPVHRLQEVLKALAQLQLLDQALELFLQLDFSGVLQHKEQDQLEQLVGVHITQRTLLRLVLLEDLFDGVEVLRLVVLRREVLLDLGKSLQLLLGHFLYYGLDQVRVLLQV